MGYDKFIPYQLQGTIRLSVDRPAFRAFVVVLGSTVNGNSYMRDWQTAYYSQIYRQECRKKASV